MNVVAMTYDDREALSDFASDQGLGYTLLSDPDGEYVEEIGIRNEEYGPGHPGFGIPHPGIMLIDASRTVLYKAAMEDYRVRPPFHALFDAVSAAVGEASAADTSPHISPSRLSNNRMPFGFNRLFQFFGNPAGNKCAGRALAGLLPACAHMLAAP